MDRLAIRRPVRQAVAMLSDSQQQTLQAPYGVPVPLLTLLDGSERFGNDGLPNDTDAPGAPAEDQRGHHVVRAERLRGDVHTPGYLSRDLGCPASAQSSAGC